MLRSIYGFFVLGEFYWEKAWHEPIFFERRNLSLSNPSLEAATNIKEVFSTFPVFGDMIHFWSD